MKILVTGAAGFIGGNFVNKLKENGIEALGIDSFSDYYSVDMKRSHLKSLGISDLVEEMDVADGDGLKALFRRFKPDVVVHLAAQGGVRASRKNPDPYIISNQLGFLNLLRNCENFDVQKFVYASSSSVYGDASKAPFEEVQELSAPKSLYALSKVSNEIIANHFPSSAIQRIGLRFFTVYGPWGRPDMAMFRLLASHRLNEPFRLTAKLETLRDFTFVTDTSQVMLEISQNSSRLDSNEVLNVAGGKPYSLKDLIEILEIEGCLPLIENHDHDALDVEKTHGSTLKISRFDYSVPATSLIDGVKQTIKWIENQPISDLRKWYESTK